MRPRIFREDGRMFAGVFVNGRNINALGGMDTPDQRRRQAHRRAADVGRLSGTLGTGQCCPGAGAVGARPRASGSIAAMDDPATRRLELARLADAVRAAPACAAYRPDPVPREDVTRHGRLAVRAANAGQRADVALRGRGRPRTRAAMGGAVDDALDVMAAWPSSPARSKEIKALRAYATFFADAPLVMAVLRAALRVARRRDAGTRAA